MATTMSDKRFAQLVSNCGSGEFRHAQHDARGIFLTFVCSKCRARKLGEFRPEVLTDPNYAHDEPIDDD